jgi:ribonuclease T2
MPIKRFSIALVACLALTFPVQAFDGPMMLALSWQPAFCETRPSVPECSSQRAGRFDTQNLVLHGLWPGPRGVEYCGVDRRIERLDRNGRWERLPGLGLPRDLQRQLYDEMPGVQSALHRHEWVKHGTCYGGDAETYFRHSLAMLEEVNTSSLGALLRRSVGRNVTLRAIQDAAERDFGRGAGERVSLKCVRDGGRELIREVRFSLRGPYRTLPIMLSRGRPARSGCDGGIIDPAGLQ